MGGGCGGADPFFHCVRKHRKTHGVISCFHILYFLYYYYYSYNIGVLFIIYFTIYNIALLIYYKQFDLILRTVPKDPCRNCVWNAYIIWVNLYFRIITYSFILQWILLWWWWNISNNIVYIMFIIAILFTLWFYPVKSKQSCVYNNL